MQISLAFIFFWCRQVRKSTLNPNAKEFNPRSFSQVSFSLLEVNLVSLKKILVLVILLFPYLPSKFSYSVLKQLLVKVPFSYVVINVYF